jgi:hypothetical protein
MDIKKICFSISLYICFIYIHKLIILKIINVYFKIFDCDLIKNNFFSITGRSTSLSLDENLINMSSWLQAYIKSIIA